MSSTRVYVIGLDGATFDLLDPWIKEGRLPNLRRVLEGSTYGRLESTIPPVTPPAWTSFMTGVNPGKHGVLDFYTFNPNSFKKVLVNSSHIRSKRFWDLAAEKGKESILLYIPLTYPPLKVEGVLISGIPAPLNGEFIYPKDKGRELEEKLGRWWVEPKSDIFFMDSYKEAILEELYRTLDIRFRVANYLMANEWDIFVLVVMETDWIQHYLWQEKDQCLLPFYTKIDGMIGHFMESLRKDDVILILSDHGFGPVHKTFYLNSWLREKGFLVSRRQWVRSKENLDLGIVHLKKESSLKQMIKWPPIKRRSGIDWERTQAYFSLTGWSYGIRINLRGREPKGIVKPGEYDEVRNRIIGELELMVEEEEGGRVVERVCRREDIYWGPYVENAPDVIVVPDPDYSLSERIGGHLIKRREEEGSFHRRDGILILHGPGVRKGRKIMGANIMDVAPTILYLLGLPVPKDCDGKVLTEALEPEVLKTFPIKIEDVPLEIRVAEFVMNGTEKEGVAKNLRGLGYID